MLKQPVTGQNSNIYSFCFLFVSLNDEEEAFSSRAKFWTGLIYTVI